jgi:T5SS/PEP-CTERM-associated repeat protein
VELHTFSFGSFDRVFVLPMFDDLDGARTLTSVEIGGAAQILVRMSITNLSASPQSFEIVVSGFLDTTVDSLSIATASIIDDFEEIFECDAVPPGESCDFGLTSFSGADTIVLSDPADLAAFVGVGPLSLRVAGNVDVQAFASKFSLVSAPFVEGTINVRYRFLDSGSGTRAWVGASGAFGEPTNWLPPMVPGSEDTALFEQIAKGTSFVTFTEDAESLELIVKGGDEIVLDLDDGGPSGHTYELLGLLDAALIVGESASDLGTLTVAEGTLTAFTGRVGSDPDATGRLNVDGARGRVALAGDLCVGCFGAGDLTITGEGTAAVNQSLRIGSNAGSVGTVSVSDDGSLLTTEGNVCVGCRGTGTVNVSGGATLFTRDASIGEQAGSFGQVTVTGDGSLWHVPFFATVDRGVVTIGSGSTLIVGFDTFGGLFLFQDGLLTGDGEVIGNVVNFGALAPGNSIGTMTIEGDYEQVGQLPGFVGASGSLNVGLADDGHGRLDVIGGSASLGGGLVVDLIDGYDPPLGTTFDIVSATLGIEGAFHVAFFPGLTGGRLLRLDSQLGPGGGITVRVDDLDTLFDGFGDPDAVTVPGTPTGVAIGDFDGESGPDLAVSLSGTPGSVLLLLNDGTGAAFTSTQYTVGPEPSDVEVGHLDGDGALDIATSNLGDGSVSILHNLDDGSGGFDPVPQTLPGVAMEATSLAVGRFTGDTRDDLAVADGLESAIVILDGDSGFAVTSSIGLSGRPTVLDPADLDQDKDTDTDLVALLGDDARVSVLLRQPGGVFAPPLDLDVGSDPASFTTGDYDLNGLSDIVVANRADDSISILLHETLGQFSPSVDLPVGDVPRSITTFDLEGDDDVDLALVSNDATGDAVVQVLRNDLFAGQLAFAETDVVVPGASPRFVATADLDVDTDDDLVVISDGAGPAPLGAQTVIEPAINATLKSCPADIDGNSEVGFQDLLLLLLAWGPCAGCPEDIDGSGAVDFQDLLLLLDAWGLCT